MFERLTGALNTRLNTWLAPVTQVTQALPPATTAPPASTPAPAATTPVPTPPAASAPLVPVAAETATAPVAEPVKGTFIEATSETGNATSLILPQANIAEAFSHTEDFRKVVETFDEDKQTAPEWVVGKLFTLAAYVMPVAFAYYVGNAIGDAFAGPHPAAGYSQYVHVASLFVEFSLTMLCFAVVIVFKRALKDRGQLGLFIGLALAFLLLSVLNSFAQLFLLEGHIAIGFDPAHLVALIAVVFRSFASLIIDIASAIYLGVSGVRSLKKYLADQQAKIEAVRETNRINIEMGQTKIKAAMDTQQAMMDMQSKAHRASTWNEIEAIQAKSMIEQARRNMRGDDDEGGMYRRRRY